MLLKMEWLLILVLIGLYLTSLNAESISSSSSSSFAESSYSSDYSSASSSSSAYSETEDSEANTPICDDNEIYDECPAPCPPKRCDVDERIIRCKAPPKLGDPECEPGCRCIDNYYRNDQDVCVPKNKCPVKCGNNEIYDICPPKCPPQECGVDPALILCAPNPEVGDPECEPGCRCIDGYYRNDFGDCIPKEKCLKCYGQNEVPGCENKCDPQTCESIGKRYSCPLIPVNPSCNPVCRCKAGYYRNKIGECISKENCLKCTRPHEYYSCGPACDNECYNLSKQNQTSCPIINIKCNEKCYCEDGYARDDKQNCIPYAKCPLKCYGQNEVAACENKCDPQTCESIGKRYNCPFIPANSPCNPVCRCKPGYYRNKIGRCISKDNCLKCTRPHEYYSCGSACDNECYNLSKQNQTHCPIINIKCNEKCYCEKGYARDGRKNCIPYAKCPPEITPEED